MQSLRRSRSEASDAFTASAPQLNAFLQLPFYDPYRFMENNLPEPRPLADEATYTRLASARVERHDGWTHEKIALFCETLAETAIVADACDAANMSAQGSYAARRRNPIFAAAWDAALTIARERLADTLLARSLNSTMLPPAAAWRAETR